MNSQPADQAARDTALRTDRSFIVQAPAGSGKTELLTQRYLKLLGQVEQPERILAITFTRKATQEMRNRIMQRLLQAKEHRTGDSHERRAVELAARVLAQNEKFHWGLLENPGRLRIFTIDALCAQLLQRDPQYAAVASHLQLLEDARPLYRQAIRRLFEDVDSPEANEDAAETSLFARLVRVLVHMDGDTLRLEELLIRMLAIRDQWTNSLGQPLTDFQRILQERQQTELAAFETALGKQSLEVAMRLVARLGAQCKDAQHPAARLASLAGDENASTAGLLWQAYWLSQLLTTGGNAPRGPNGVTRKRLFADLDGAADAWVADLQGLYRGWYEHPPALQAIERMAKSAPLDSGFLQDGLLDDVLELLRFLLAELNLVIIGEGQTDFQFLAERALLCLRGSQPEGEAYGDVLLAEDRRLDHLLLDEFQDTSHTQHRLLRQLVGGWAPGDGRTLFLVGDPMQSIYRFRSADVGLFTRVLQQGRMGDVPVQALSLTANFRSLQEVVGWINHQFSAVFPARDERDSGAVRYHPAVAEQQGGGGVRIHALTPDETDEDEARLITAVIRESLQLPGVNEIAVLARARKHLRALAQELVRAGIDFEAVKVDELAGRPVILDLLAITRAVLHPHDRVAAAALLRAPWCGLRLPELHCVLGEQPADAIWQHIKLAQKDPQIADESRDRLTMLSRVMETTSQLRGILSLRELVEFSWLQLGGPFAYADESELENAAEFLALLDRIEQVGPSDLVQRLNEGLEALYAQARPARVRLMTIHQAKGLEFDVVILPGLHRATSKREQPLIIAQQFPRDGHPGDQPPPEESGLLMAPVTQRGQDAPSIYRYLGAVDTERQAYESVRLLYVAATRAKKHLHLCGRVKFSQKSGCYAEAGSCLQMLLPAFETAFSTRDYRAGGKAPRREQQPVSLPLLRLVNAPAARLEAPEIPPADASRLITLPDRDAVALGQALHLWLELIHDHRDRVWTSAWFAEHTGMLTSLLRRTGANPGSVASLLPRLCRMIQMALETENGRQAVSPDQTAESHAELTLFQREGNRIGQRIIDRLYRNEDGRWHIVDYKSGTSAPNPLQRWNDQLNEYAALVSEALGAELPGCRIYQAETGELVALECLMQDGSVSSDKGVVA